MTSRRRWNLPGAGWWRRRSLSRREASTGSRSRSSGRRSRRRRLRWTPRATKIVLGILFVYLTYFFGGLVGGVLGLALTVLRLRWRNPGFFWGLGVASMTVAALSVPVQGLAPGPATPGFVSLHWVAHLLIGLALASIALGTFLEIARERERGSDQDLGATDRAAEQGERSPVET